MLSSVEERSSSLHSANEMNDEVVGVIDVFNLFMQFPKKVLHRLEEKLKMI